MCINNSDPVLTEFDNDGKSRCHLSFRQIRIITGRAAGRHVGNSINQEKCFPFQRVSISCDLVPQAKLTDRPRRVQRLQPRDPGASDNYRSTSQTGC